MTLSAIPLLLAAALNLEGVIVDDAAKPIAGAHVYVYTAAPKVGVSALCPSCYRDCGKHVRVDESGRFTLKELDPTLVFDILAVAPGFEPALARSVDPSRGEVAIPLTRRSVADADRLVTGVVKDEAGKPVIGALVEPAGYRVGRRVGYGNVPGVDKLSITDERGEFALRIPDASASLDVRVTSRSHAPRIERMLRAAEPREIRVSEGATITGRVVRGGKPLQGVRVAAIQRNRASSGFLGKFEIGTNEEGKFVMTNLAPDETYVLYVPMEGLPDGAVEPKIVTTGAAALDAGTLNVVTGRRVAGCVFLPAGKTVPAGTSIVIGSPATSDVRKTTLGPDGSFAFTALPDGPLRLTLRLPGLQLAPDTPGLDERSSSVALPERGDVENVALVFR